MTDDAPDTRYAYLMLGLEPGVPFERITEVFTHALSYRFRTRERTNVVRRLMEFFAAKNLLGSLEDPFPTIQKAYRDKVRALHPDLHHDDPYAEEKLKEVNVAYGIVEDVHKEAEAYFKQPADIRQAIEEEARQAYARERGKRNDPEAQNRPEEREAPRSTYEEPYSEAHGTGLKYMAASVPRSIRASRLPYLRSDYIIGSWYITAKNGSHHIFDVIMLPEKEFARARIYLSVPNITDPALQRGSFAPTYIVKDVHEVVIPAGERDPNGYAKARFLKTFKFGAQDGNTG